MSTNPEKRAEEALQKLRKLKCYCPLTPEEAEAEFDAGPAVPVSDERVKSLVESILSGEMTSWEPVPDLGWADDMDLSEVECDARQLYRNQGEADDESRAAEDALRKELLADGDDSEDEDGLDGGAKPPSSCGE
jgi:hypothetical protein